MNIFTTKPFKPCGTLTYRLYSNDGTVLIETGTADNLRDLKKIIGNLKVTYVKSPMINNEYNVFLII